MCREGGQVYPISTSVNQTKILIRKESHIILLGVILNRNKLNVVFVESNNGNISFGKGIELCISLLEIVSLMLIF